MSLHQLANHMSAQGRGPDSTLVHMSPREVSGLQSLAMAHGGTLTINPQTGLPEAGFLDSLLPTLLGGAATFFSGGAITPFMAALGVGGLTALTSKDLGKGLMAGLGAYGGSGILEGLEGFGANAIGAEAATASGSFVDNAAADAASRTAQTGASYSDRLSRGLTEGFKNPMGAVKAIGGGSTFKGAAMIGAPLLSALSSQDQTSVPTFDQIKFDPRPANINIRRDQLPYQRDTGSSGQRGYFGPTYVTQYAGGGEAVSDNGIEHFGAGGRTRRDPVENMPYIRNGQSLTPADLVNLGNRGSKSFTPVIRPNQPEKPVVQQPIQPAPQQPIQPITQQPIEPTRPVAQQPMEPPRPQQPMEPTRPPQRHVDETGMVPKQVVENPVIVPRLEGGRDSAAKGGLMALAVGGGVPLDPDYDYSGYGRKKTDVTRPVTPMPDVPKPDFLAADGKTYRYDPIKRSWYVIKEAEAKTNPGVETLMGGAGMGGNVDTPSQFDNPGGVRTTPEMSLPVAYAAGKISGAFLGPRQGPAAPVEDRIADRETMAEIVGILNGLTTTGADISGGQFAGNTSPSTNTGATGMNTGTTGGTPAQAGDIGISVDTGVDPQGEANGGMVGRYAQGGLGSLGGYSDGGRLLRGPGDGVSDSIPATVGDRQPARLADGEFVVPARIVSELGNGSTEAGARALYKMMDRIQANRRKTTGKNSVAVNSKSHKYLPA